MLLACVLPWRSHPCSRQNGFSRSEFSDDKIFLWRKLCSEATKLEESFLPILNAISFGQHQSLSVNSFIRPYHKHPVESGVRFATCLHAETVAYLIPKQTFAVAALAQARFCCQPSCICLAGFYRLRLCGYQLIDDNRSAHGSPSAACMMQACL